MQDRNGVWVENSIEIESVFVDYFTEIFKSLAPDDHCISEAIDSIPQCVTPKMNDFLNALFTEEDIRYALFQIFPTKAPRPDGLSALFFQHFWNVIKDKTLVNCLSILNHRSSTRALNRTNIVLIPKVKLPRMASDYRPISLCNVSYSFQGECQHVKANSTSNNFGVPKCFCSWKDHY